MAKQTKYNYRGRPQGSYMSYRAQLEILDDTPTHKQKSFLANLAKRLKAHGIDPFEDQQQRPFTRAMYADEIDRLIKICEEHGLYQRMSQSESAQKYERRIFVSNDSFRDGDIRVSDRIVSTKRPATRVLSAVVPLEIYKIELLLQKRDFTKVRTFPRGQEERVFTEYGIKISEKTQKPVACIDEVWERLAEKFPEGAAEHKNFTVCHSFVKNGILPRNIKEKENIYA